MNPPAGFRDRLLLLSHRMPCPEGDEAQRRAWAWLEASDSRFDVWLMVMADRRINLSQWQHLQPMAARLSLASPGDVGSEVTSWSREQSFSACLCTSPCLWPRVESLSVGHCIVDVAPSKPMRGHRLAIWRSSPRLAQRAAANCHRLVLAHRADATEFPKAWGWTKIIPADDMSAMDSVLREAGGSVSAPGVAWPSIATRQAA